jgi:hypothetical protein
MSIALRQWQSMAYVMLCNLLHHLIIRITCTSNCFRPCDKSRDKLLIEYFVVLIIEPVKGIFCAVDCLSFYIFFVFFFLQWTDHAVSQINGDLFLSSFMPYNNTHLWFSKCPDLSIVHSHEPSPPWREDTQTFQSCT